MTTEETPDGQPTMEELQERMREVVRDMKRSISTTTGNPELKARAPRQTLPAVDDQSRRAS